LKIIIGVTTPAHNSGDQDDIRNYRPISVLSRLAKLFEYLIVRNIQFRVNSILFDEQYGIQPNRSSTLNIIVCNNFTLMALENYDQFDVIFTPKLLIR